VETTKLQYLRNMLSPFSGWTLKIKIACYSERRLQGVKVQDENLSDYSLIISNYEM
jgi:hypothetical protein